MDVLFKIIEIDEEKNTAVLKGLDMRLLADARLEDLVYPDTTSLKRYRKRSEDAQKECVRKIYRRRSLEREQLRGASGRSPDDFFEVPGKILHLDGDEDYLAECLKAYQS